MRGVTSSMIPAYIITVAMVVTCIGLTILALWSAVTFL